MPEAGFPSCFGGEYGGVESNESSNSRNVVSCLYRVKLGGQARVITVTWFRNFLGQGLSLSLDDDPKTCCKVEMRPWLFWKKQGSKTFTAAGETGEIHWDFTSARFTSGVPEPRGSFYVVIVWRGDPVLLLGDMQEDALKKLAVVNVKKSGVGFPPAAALVSRRENLFGSKFFSTKARFCEGGEAHEVMIECSDMSSYSGSFDSMGVSNGGYYSSSSASAGSSSSNGSGRSSSNSSGRRSSGARSGGASREPRLVIRIDRKIVVCVKRLAWKFRGNQTVVIDGQAVEVFWDVHNWLFNGSGSAVFMFQMCSGLALESEKPWFKTTSHQQQQQQPQQQMQLCSTSSSSSSSSASPGFSLFLHAYRYSV